jgi:hypothetical protein
MLENEVRFYEANRASLREQYVGKHLAIVNNRVLGVYDSFREAYNETIKTETPGNFMIKFIPVDPDREIVWLSLAGTPVSSVHL